MGVDMLGNPDKTLVEIIDERIDGKTKTKRKASGGNVSVSVSKAKVRKHLVTTAYKSDVAEKLDKLSAAGHTVLSVTASSDVRGFDVISYIEE